MGSQNTYINDEFINSLINETDRRFSSIDLSQLLVMVIDCAPYELLRDLAEQFDVNGIEWELADSEDKKRKLIKDSVILHRYKGTFYGVKRVLGILNIEGEIEEYDKYNGRWHHFKVHLNIVNDTFDMSKGVKLISLLNEYKPLRSKLDNLQINLIVSADICITTYMVTQNEIFVPDYDFNSLYFSNFYDDMKCYWCDKEQISEYDGNWN